MLDIQSVLQGFKQISLDELNKVPLLNRVDTKFVVATKMLPSILKDIQSQQYVLEINGKRIFNYRTHYYDTKNLTFYKDHHNGCVNRIKVRTREYTDSGIAFYEIKNKLRGTRTDKQRKQIATLPDFLESAEYDMINYKRYNGEKLKVKLSNDFDRITLTNLQFTERITIDTNISFKRKKKEVSLPHIAVIEVKQSKSNSFSHTIQTLKKYGVRPASFSKYAVGLVLLKKKLKKNNFKPILLKIKKLENV